MDDFFSHVPDARWSQQRRLHIYATPPDELRGVVAEQQALLGDTPAEDYGLGLVPPQWLHATVQMLLPSLDELDALALSGLTAALRRRLAVVEPLSLHVGPPQVSAHAVELWIDPAADAQWRWLVESVRAAVTDELGAHALPPLGPNITPHSSIAYGIGPGDSGKAMSALKSFRQPLVTWPVTEVHLVAVTQHPGVGWFDWEEIVDVPLSGSSPASARITASSPAAGVPSL